MRQNPQNLDCIELICSIGNALRIRYNGEIGQLERRLAIAAIAGANECEERGVLLKRECCAIAECPAARVEIETENLDFADKGFGHDALLDKIFA